MAKLEAERGYPSTVAGCPASGTNDGETAHLSA